LQSLRKLTHLQVYVKALDKEDHLVPVAFLDIPPFITSLKMFRSLLLIDDMVKSVWLAVSKCVSIPRLEYGLWLTLCTGSAVQAG
jgi:hypothetical protein